VKWAFKVLEGFPWNRNPARPAAVLANDIVKELNFVRIYRTYRALKNRM
jgi:hypothetical protein